jgi:16S rRNA (cytosine1402-N4)-methyltransferase
VFGLIIFSAIEMHTPVLEAQVMKHFDIQNGMKVIDCTFGEGGHTESLAHAGATVLALDADQAQIDRYRQSKTIAGNIQLVCANYADIEHVATVNGFEKVDRILADFGLSMNQMHHGEGYSYQFPHQPLGLVIDTVAKLKGATRAADVVNGYDEGTLHSMFARYGEIQDAKRFASALVRARKMKHIATVGDLNEVIAACGMGYAKAKIYQALRIEVNDEYKKIQMLLNGAWRLLKLDGLLGLITFHSGEDRIVKLWARSQHLKEVVRIKGSDVSEESFERSAVLRIYKKIV